MAENPPRGMQRIVPYLLYEDGPAALAFLCKSFGFEERMRVERGDGSLVHAEVGCDGNVVMLGTPLDASGRPRSLREQPRTSCVMCYVDDVDAHHARAREAGAKITAELAEQPYGDRMYGAEDPEGHVWYFATHVRDPEPGD